MELAGRDGEIEQFKILLGRLKLGRTEQSLIVTGLRGVGKTVLLNTFEDEAESQGYLTFFHELTPESDLIDELVRDAQVAMARLSPGVKAIRAFKSGLAYLSTIKFSTGDGLDFSVDLTGANEGTITSDLTALFLELGRLAEKNGKGIAIFLDELQFVREIEYRATISALHRVNQKSLPLTIAAAALPTIPKLSGDARSYAERLFTFPMIADLSVEDATRALVAPAQRKQVTFEVDAVEKALEWTGGYPFYLQQLGKHAWNLAKGTSIGAGDVESAIPAATSALDAGIYEVRLQRATENERKYLAAMASIGPGPYLAGQIAEAHGKASATALSPVRQTLLDKGLIYSTETYGYVDFTIPRFDEFVRRQKIAFK